VYRDDKYKKRRRGEEEVRPGDLRRPAKPSNGPAAQEVGVPLARAFFMDNFLKTRIGQESKANLKDQDSRDELLKYASKVGQPTNWTPLAAKTLEQEKDEVEQEERRALGLGMR
jgi:hypothetical protein